MKKSFFSVFLITASLFITCNQSNISFDNKLLDYEIPDDSIINIFIEPYTKQIIDSDLNTPLSYSPVKYTKKDGELNSTLSNLFADAIEAFDPRIDLAVVNSGALRQDIKPGTVTKGDLISAFPFPNTVVMTKLKGSQVVKIFNHAAGMTNGILQVSKNAKYSFIPRNKAHEIWIKGKPIKNDDEYWVAAPNFVTQGGDGYWEFQNSIEYIDTGVLIVDAAEYFLQDMEVYEPKYEGRVLVIDSEI